MVAYSQLIVRWQTSVVDFPSNHNLMMAEKLFAYIQDPLISLWRDDDGYRLNWSDTAENIEHFVSCVNEPYKGASTIMQGLIVRIFKLSEERMLKLKIESLKFFLKIIRQLLSAAVVF